MGDPVYSAEPDDIPTARLGRLSMWLRHAVAAAAPDDSVSVVSPPAGSSNSAAPLQGDQQNHPFRSSSSSPLTPRFLLENFWLDKHVRYILTTHPVVVLWLAGTLSNSDSPGSQVYIFTGSVWPPHTWSICFFSLFAVYRFIYRALFYLFFPLTASILALSALMFVVRIALVVWRHYKRPLYSSSGPNLSPVEIALTQRKLFLWSFIQLSLFLILFLVDAILVSYFAIFK